MRSIFYGLFIFTAILPNIGNAKSCATEASQMRQTSPLRVIQEFFGEKPSVGLVNETGGSYVVLNFYERTIEIEFYTSGFFDLVPVKRSGPVQFCDDQGTVVMIGLGREEPLRVISDRLIVGRGGAKNTFYAGSMPSALAKIHRIESRGIASQKDSSPSSSSP